MQQQIAIGAVFSSSTILASASVQLCRCQYLYDAFGNLNQKNCSSGTWQYLIDPFGAYGSEIIAEVK